MNINFFAVFFILVLSVFCKASDYGVFMVVKGDVKVIKTDNQNQAAKVGLKVNVGDTIISAADSRAKIVMSDRNVISISPMTTLKISKYVTGADKNVELNLSEGKVRTNVEQEYDGEKSQFLIKTPSAVAGVRGTQFITSYDSKSKVTEVVTLRGQVAFTNLAAKDFRSANTVLIKKGEASSLSQDQAPEKPKQVPKETLKSIDRESNFNQPPPPPSSNGQGPEVGQDKKSDSDSKGELKGEPKGDLRKDPKSDSKNDSSMAPPVDSRDLKKGPEGSGSSQLPPPPPPPPGSGDMGGRPPMDMMRPPGPPPVDPKVNDAIGKPARIKVTPN